MGSVFAVRLILLCSLFLQCLGGMIAVHGLVDRNTSMKNTTHPPEPTSPHPPGPTSNDTNTTLQPGPPLHPTFSPSASPTLSPTPSPSASPTLSPTKHNSTTTV